MKLIYIGLFGVLGVLSCHWLGVLISRYLILDFPVATFVVNLTGSFLIGVVYAAGIERGLMGHEVTLELMTGFLGGFTTFSALSLEVVHLGAPPAMQITRCFST